ncbi:hypothetical protein KIN20_026094 [Parelaphostrongylus tenuis]|uniref:C2H2-type domain-containing protein n=1 Tax=Parelaphostrongylus tenuis TaxID=148309 RepID=A0AAD5NDM1_PARTN|nr:hypothetical protein KIN20_026094 [Parelaphostrongylus tenuis]
MFSKSIVKESDDKLYWSLNCAAFVCPMCGLRSTDQVQVNSHISTCHTEVDPTTCMISDCWAPRLEESSSFFIDIPEHDMLTDVNSESWVAVDDMKSSFKAADGYINRSSEQSVDIALDDEENIGLDSMVCSLCNQSVKLAKLTHVLEHAKEHYNIKQFECELCGFGNNKRSVVRYHASSQHLYKRARIIEHNDGNIRKAWIQVARTCFPRLPERLMKENTKHLQSFPTSGVVFKSTTLNDVSSSEC